MSGTEERLQNLLRFAVAAGGQGNTDQPVSDTTEDRTWLRDAIQDYAAGALTINPVDFLKKQLSTIYRFMHPALPEDKKIEISDVHHALSEIHENCEDYDLAGDLHRIGGFDIMIQCLQAPDLGMRKGACEILGGACQNHEYCQKALIEMKVLPNLMKLVENSTVDDDANQSVRIKAFFALSCLIRGNEVALSQFEENDGFSMISNVLHSGSDRLKLKASFFIRSICTEHPKSAMKFHTYKADQQIIMFLISWIHRLCSYQGSSYDAGIEDLIQSLITLATSCKDIKTECSKQEHRLRSELKCLAMWCSAKDGTEECMILCNNLLNMCFATKNGVND